MARVAASLMLVVAGLAAGGTRGADVPPPPLEAFDDGGLASMGMGSVAAALRGLEDSPATAGGLPFDVVVKGPSGPDALMAPLAAEVRSRIESFDVAAGVKADRLAPEEGAAGWTGRIGVSAERESGREVFELRTKLDRRHEVGVFGLEVGPRIERRLRRGALFFFDGKAEAQATRSADSGWALPGSPEADGFGAVGVTARTGFSR
jgi:hypothetical protein